MVDSLWCDSLSDLLLYELLAGEGGDGVGRGGEQLGQVVEEADGDVGDGVVVGSGEGAPQDGQGLLHLGRGGEGGSST